MVYKRHGVNLPNTQSLGRILTAFAGITYDPQTKDRRPISSFGSDPLNVQDLHNFQFESTPKVDGPSFEKRSVPCGYCLPLLESILS